MDDKASDPKKPKDFGKDRTVILVEDDLSSAELLRGVLQSVGFEVITAEDGRQAWQKISDNPVQLIVIDVIMPEMDGFSLFKELKNNKETTGIPIVVVSSRKNMEDTFLASGAEGFFSKPLDTENFLSSLSKLPLKRKQDDQILKEMAEKQAPKEEEEKEKEKKE